MTWAADILAWLRALDPRIWQAVVGGGFLAAGWVFNGRQNRRDAAKRRAERLRDAHRALFAEIDAHLSNLLSEAAIRDYGAEIVARMRADPDYLPLIPRERHDRLFAALEGEIHILPRVTIDPIVHYYSQLDTIAAHVDDMRGKRFQTLSQERRIAMHEDYIEMLTTALRLGRIAVSMIGVFASGGKDAAEAEARRLSSRDADPSGR